MGWPMIVNKSDYYSACLNKTRTNVQNLVFRPCFEDGTLLINLVR